MGVVGRCSYSSLALWLACTYIANDTKAAKLDCGFTGYSTSHATRLPGVQDGLGATEAKSLKRPVCRVGNTFCLAGERRDGRGRFGVAALFLGLKAMVMWSRWPWFFIPARAGSKERRGK
jgi:hypothetical protein